MMPRVAHRLDGRLETLLARHAKLRLKMKVRRGDERVDASPFRRFDRFGGFLQVSPVAARETGDGRPADFLRDAMHGLRVGRRRNRESGLDDVHAERIELPGQPKLFGYPQGESGSLLAIAQRRVENSDVLCHRRPHRRNVAGPAASSRRDSLDTVKMIIFLFGLSVLMRL
jgi:hypothetical protein